MDLEASYDRLEISQLRLPTVDHYEPSLDDILKAHGMGTLPGHWRETVALLQSSDLFPQLPQAVAFIDEFRKRGQKVYVHCKAGHQRDEPVLGLGASLAERPH